LEKLGGKDTFFECPEKNMKKALLLAGLEDLLEG
jgi:hypothetical protein